MGRPALHLRRDHVRGAHRRRLGPQDVREVPALLHAGRAPRRDRDGALRRQQALLDLAAARAARALPRAHRDHAAGVAALLRHAPERGDQLPHGALQQDLRHAPDPERRWRRGRRRGGREPAGHRRGHLRGDPGGGHGEEVCHGRRQPPNDRRGEGAVPVRLPAGVRIHERPCVRDGPRSAGAEAGLQRRADDEPANGGPGGLAVHREAADVVGQARLRLHAAAPVLAREPAGPVPAAGRLDQRPAEHPEGRGHLAALQPAELPDGHQAALLPEPGPGAGQAPGVHGSHQARKAG
mmetsp:Transcript_23682/g.68364  ORF Transcript_23682/g.68364 Transcript_23682/m.68364 type:complete len:295 (+) Transcript_23682:987-1871(+)